MNNVVPFKQLNEIQDRLINQLIADNKEIIIGTSYPKMRLKELQDKFPQARFEICGLGVKLCSSK